MRIKRRSHKGRTRQKGKAMFIMDNVSRDPKFMMWDTITYDPFIPQRKAKKNTLSSPRIKFIMIIRTKIGITRRTKHSEMSENMRSMKQKFIRRQHV